MKSESTLSICLSLCSMAALFAFGASDAEKNHSTEMNAVACGDVTSEGDVKVLFPEVARENTSYVKRFLREAKIATRIRHPNLVAVHDCGFDEARGLYDLVMDYVSGGDLRQAIAFAGHFDPDRAVEVVMQVASALEAAQKYHVVHRDIKPENIMIQPDGLVKLVIAPVPVIFSTPSLSSA